MNEIEQLIKQALEIKKNSYSPYSNFRVASVVKTRSGKVYKGVNIENAAYGPSLCAERSALSSAITDGEMEFEYIIVNGDSHDTFPCGVCRQFILEFADKDTKIVIANSEDDYSIYSIEELLPHSFSSEDLK